MSLQSVFSDVKGIKIVFSGQNNVSGFPQRVRAMLFASGATMSENLEKKKVMAVTEDHEKAPVQQITKGRDPILSVTMGALQPEIIELMTGGTFSSNVGRVEYPYQFRVPAGGAVPAITDTRHVLFGAAANTAVVNAKDIYDNTRSQNLTRIDWDNVDALPAGSFKQGPNMQMQFSSDLFEQYLTAIGRNESVTHLELSSLYLGSVQLFMSVLTSTDKLYLIHVPVAEVNPGATVDFGADEQSFDLTMYPTDSAPKGYRIQLADRRGGRGY